MSPQIAPQLKGSLCQVCSLGEQSVPEFPQLASLQRNFPRTKQPQHSGKDQPRDSLSISIKRLLGLWSLADRQGKEGVCMRACVCDEMLSEQLASAKNPCSPPAPAHWQEGDGHKKGKRGREGGGSSVH